MKSLRILPLLLALSAPAFALNPSAPAPVPYKVPLALPGTACSRLNPRPSRIDGWLGARIDANVTGRLDVVDTGPRLAGDIKKPGAHPWIGEHVGKWLHAATLAWAYSGDTALREKLDSSAAQLVCRPRARWVPGDLPALAAVRALPGRGLGRVVPRVQHDRAPDLLSVHWQQTGAQCRSPGSRSPHQDIPRKGQHPLGGDPRRDGRDKRPRAGRRTLPADGRRALPGVRKVHRGGLRRARRPRGSSIRSLRPGT